MAKKFYITTPIYYVNDRPHVGHAYTTIAADVLARHYRAKKYEVFFLTGTDEYGDKVAESAEQHGMHVHAFVDQNSQAFREAFDRLNIKYDIFMRTTMPEHEASVNIFIEKLSKAGALYQDEYVGLYCRSCEDFYTEKDLIDGLCPIHKKPLEQLKEKNWFFRLETYLPAVQKLITSGKMKIEPTKRKTEVLGLFKQGLKDFSVTRERVQWGIPFAQDPRQKIYVWVEALQNYISAIGYGRDSERFKKWWPADVHLMAKDIIKFHAVYWPAMLLAAGEKPPKKIFSHGFFSINGQKMSKTTGNVIDPNTMVQKFGADATRYLLLTQFPFGSDGDIKESLFVEKYNADLANNLGNLVSRVLNMIEKYTGGAIPKIVASPKSLASVGKHIESLEFDKALKEIGATITWANGYIDTNAPWDLAKDPSQKSKLETVLSELAAVLKELAPALGPFMPVAAAEIHKRLEQPSITKGQPLFQRLA